MVKTYKFLDEELNTLKNLFALGQEQAQLVLKHNLTETALRNTYNKMYSEAFKRLGIDQSRPGFKLEIKFDLNKNEIVVEETPEIIAADAKSMKDVAKTQAVINKLNGKN